MGEEGEHIYIYIYRYTFTTRMTPILRWAAMRAILMFIKCEGQSHKTVSTNHKLFEEKGEPKQNRAETHLLTARPNRLTH